MKTTPNFSSLKDDKDSKKECNIGDLEDDICVALKKFTFDKKITQIKSKKNVSSLPFNS